MPYKYEYGAGTYHTAWYGIPIVEAVRLFVITIWGARARANMPEARVTLDPKSTPGFIHASELTAESANAAVRALQSSRDYDIFTSDEPVQPGEPQEDAR